MITKIINNGNSSALLFVDFQLVFVERQEIVSGGNFHGEYPAKVLDFLAIGVHELASISERRIERLVNPCMKQFSTVLVFVFLTIRL